MKNKKGFTLIELLAVIVILAIIALIAVPTIMNILNKANMRAFKNTAYGIISAGELYFSQQQLNSNGLKDDLEFVFPTESIKIKGNVPEGTILKISSTGQIAVATSNGRFCITKDFNESSVTVYENPQPCSFAGTRVSTGDSTLTLLNSDDGSLTNYKIYGNSVQNGTPSLNNPVEIESVGDKTKNLFDINGGFATNNEYKGTKIEGRNIIIPYTNSNSPSAEFEQYIPVDENEVYTCGFELIQGLPRILIKLYDESKQIIDDESISIPGFSYNTFYQGFYADVNQITIDLPSNVKYIRLATAGMNNSEGIDNIYSNFQFVQGKTITEYEPYNKYSIPIKVSNNSEEVITNIYLDEPLRKIGDYADYIDFEDKKIARKIQEYKFTGTETVLYHSSKNNYAVVLPFPSDINSPALSNYYKSTNKWWSLLYSGEISANTTDGITAGFSNDNYIGEAFKSYLLSQYNSGNPVNIVYVLATPTEETIELPNIPMFNGSTKLEVNTKIKPSNIIVNY